MRRLAAIVFVDFVGFSRLMAIDEDGTWSDLQQLRGLIDPLFQTGGGRIVKSTGDGVLVESPSVIEAVGSAIAVQDAADDWNAARSADRQIRLRIGVNLGDVIIADDGDVYGDGVNVAARLESLADPGGICLSDSAYRQVRGRVEARFVDRGEQWVKNIPIPVRVWAVVRGSTPGGDADVGVSGLERAEMVGRGGNATVYRAYQPSMDRWVAVKVLDGSDETTRRRFDRERQAMGRLSQHPGIVTIYESGYTSAGRPYLVMPFLGSGSLQDRLDRSGPMPWQEATDLLTRVTGAVEYAHAAGIVHRDLKPGNIMMDEEGRPLVADFGIARLAGQSQTITEYMALTPAFSPPELLDGGEPTKAGDIYALAATFCALVNGTPPFVTGSPDADTLLALSNRIAHDPPPDLRPLGVPRRVCEAVETAMSKNPADRPESASAFAEALAGRGSSAGAGRGSSPTAESVDRRSIAWPRIGAGLGVVGAIAIGAIAVGSLGGTESPASTPATTAAAVSESLPETTAVADPDPGDDRVRQLAEFDTPIRSLTALDDVAYVALEDGTVHAIDAESGDAVWGEPFVAGGVASDLLVADGRLFFVRGSSKLIYSVDTATGGLEWRILAPFDSAQNRPFIDESNGNLAVGFGQGVAMMEAVDGSEVWKDPTGATLLVEAVSFDGQLLAVSDGRWVYGVNARTGERQWRTGPPDIGTPDWIMAQEIEVDSGTGRGFERRVFVLTDGNLVLLDGEDGEIRWSVPVSGPPGSAPDTTAFVSGVDGELMAVDAGPGTVAWREPEVAPDPPPVRFGDVVLAVDGTELVILNARSGSVRDRIALPEGRVTHVDGASGRAIVVSANTLLSVSISE